MKTRKAGIVALLTLTCAAAAGAYTLNGPRWGVQQVPYYINPVNQYMPEADAIAAIQQGAATWSTQSNANIVPYYMGRTSGSSISKNGLSEVFFRNTANGSLYGETYWWYDSSYRLIEADVVFYSTFPFYSGAAGCSGRSVYLVDATAHEFGHVLGLGHSSVSSATMYPTMKFCSTNPRSLDPDDLAGIEALYPAGALNAPPAVSITSPSSGATVTEGTATNLSGSANDQEDGNLSAYVSWRSSRDGSLGTGASLTRVLSAGTHTITASVTDSKGATTQAQRTITVETAPVQTPPPPSGFVLSGSGYKVKGQQKADLTWSGTAATSIDVYRDGTRITTTKNDGSHIDPINRKGGGHYSYVVCAAGTSTCSNTIQIVF